MDDVGAVLLGQVRGEERVRRLGRGREERDLPSRDVRGRPRAQRGRDHLRRQRQRAAVQLLPARSGLGHRQDHEVGDEVPELVQVAGRRRPDRCAPLTTRIRRAVATGGIAAPLPSKSTSSGSSSTASRAPSRTFETATAPARPPPQRRQPTVSTPGERRGLEVVGGGVAAAARELEQRLDVRRDRRRPPAPAARRGPSRRRRRAGRGRRAGPRAR